MKCYSLALLATLILSFPRVSFKASGIPENKVQLLYLWSGGLMTVSFLLEYSSIGESVWGRPAASHHFPPECGATQQRQRDHRVHCHWNSRGEMAIFVWYCRCALVTDDAQISYFKQHLKPCLTVLSLLCWLIGGPRKDDWQLAPDLPQRNIWETRGCSQCRCLHVSALFLCLCLNKHCFVLWP